jgi:putative tricarboxylic transport membrane protein
MGALHMKFDRILGVGAVILAIPVGIASWGFGVGSPKSPGAGFWPLLIAVVMLGLGLSLILRPTPDAAPAAGASRWRQFGISLGTLAFCVAAMEPLGYLLTIVIMLSAQLRWVENRPWKSSAAIAVMTAVISLIIFRVLLKVSLPVGVIPLPKGW